MEQQLTKQGAEDLLRRQKAYFRTGETLSYQFRAERLAALKRAVLARQDQLEQALKADLGKCSFESYATEVGFILSSISHTLSYLKRWMRPEKQKTPISLMGCRSRVEKQPYGSVYIIGPYNYPFQLLIEPLIGAMAAGNCAVLSPSELAPNVARVTMELIRDTFEEAYVACVEGGVDNNTLLLQSPFDYIFFTGSVRVGRVVMEAAAKQLIPVTLELGGKSPVIVDRSANLSLAAQRILWGKLMNAGQTCVAPDYVLAPREKREELVARLEETLARFYGPDAKDSPDYGRIINTRHMERLKAILDRDRAVIRRGGEVDMEQRYIQPTILCPDGFEAAAMEEELFGPILPVLAYDSLDQALDYVNSNPKPLALYVFSEDRGVTERILRRTTSGGVSVNDTISHIINPNLPFGGVGTAGMGRYHGKYSFDTFSHHRSVLEKTTRFPITLTFPPFTDRKLNMVKKALR